LRREYQRENKAIALLWFGASYWSPTDPVPSISTDFSKDLRTTHKVEARLEPTVLALRMILVFIKVKLFMNPVTEVCSSD